MAKLTFKKPPQNEKHNITIKYVFYKYLVKSLFTLNILQLIIITYLLAK